MPRRRDALYSFGGRVGVPGCVPLGGSFRSFLFEIGLVLLGCHHSLRCRQQQDDERFFKHICDCNNYLNQMN